MNAERETPENVESERLAADLHERLHLLGEEMEASRALLYEHVDGVERRMDERLRRLEK